MLDSTDTLPLTKAIHALSYIVIMAMLWSCSSTAYVVESDYSYAGTFHRYKSFSFGENKSFGGSEADKVLVEKYIGSVLTAWGYETGASKPDLYVFYSFYFEDFAYRGYNQPYLQQWIHYNHPAYGKELSQLDTGLDSLNNVLNKTESRTANCIIQPDVKMQRKYQ